MNYDYIVLVGEYIGGAEIFTLEKIRAGAWTGQIVMNPKLAKCLSSDSAYDGINVVVLEELELLAHRITVNALRMGASALDRRFSNSNILLGNLKASAMQLGSMMARRRNAFVHDNCTYLNTKATLLISMICLRSRHSYFASEHARAAVPWIGRVFSSTSVHYFADVPPVSACSPSVAESLRIMNVGRIERNKGQLLTAQIAGSLRVYFPNVSVTLVGTICEPDYYEEVQKTLLKHGIAFNQKCVSHDDVSATMRAHDLVLHTSTVESLPLVLFEAAAAGLPFFALPVGGIPEVLPAAYQISGAAEVDALCIAKQFGAITAANMQGKSNAAS